MLFAVPREGLTAKVHKRVNVRVLELVDEETGSRIELEDADVDPLLHLGGQSFTRNREQDLAGLLAPAMAFQAVNLRLRHADHHL